MFVVTFTNGKAIRVICRNNGQAIAVAKVLATKLNTVVKTVTPT
jgi:hypothetical protein